MSPPDPLQRLRDAFEAVGRADAASLRRRARRRRTRNATFAAVGVLGLGGVAVGSDLISVGEPEPSPQFATDRSQPAGDPRIVLRAGDDPLDWGVQPYRANDGKSCALAGQIRGTQLGLVRDGVFRPYGPDRQGPCREIPRYLATLSPLDHDGRTVLYGRIAPRVRSVAVIEADGTRTEHPAGPRGTFLFVFSGPLELGSYDVEYLDASGRPLRR